MKNQIEESDFSTVVSEKAISTRAVRISKRTKALLGITALLAAALVSNLSRADQVGAKAHAASSPELDIILVPERGTKVYVQGAYRYHWRENCSLTSAESLRPEGKKPELKRDWMNLGEAEKKNLHPCIYCARVQN